MNVLKDEIVKIKLKHYLDNTRNLKHLTILNSKGKCRKRICNKQINYAWIQPEI